MMKKLTINILLLLVLGFEAYAWGGYEHSVIAYAAQDHLTENAQRNIRRYLDQPIYEYAEWMDYTAMQNFPGYEILKNGHCFAVCYDGYIPKNAPYADGQCAGYPYMKEVIETLKHHRELPDSLVALHLRCFLHMIGDMHCPGHVMLGDYPHDGSIMNKSYRFGDYRQFRVKCWWDGSHQTIHWLWDTPLQHIHGDWSFDDWCHFLDVWTLAQQKAVADGSLEQYLEDAACLAKKLYNVGEGEANYDSRFYTPEIQEDIYYLIRASIYRLAHILNDCFDYAD